MAGAKAMPRLQDFTGLRGIQTPSEKTLGTEKNRERDYIYEGVLTALNDVVNVNVSITANFTTHLLSIFF